MPLREAINRHPGAAAAVVVAVLAAAGGGLWLYSRPPAPPPRPTHQYFYDLASRSLWVVPIDEIPPIEGPSRQPTASGEPAGVKAHVFSCSSCEDEKSRFIGYLETNSAEGKAALLAVRRATGGPAQRPQPQLLMTAAQGRQVAREDATEWVRAGTTEARKIVDAPSERCRGKAVPCAPPAPRAG